MNVAERNEGEFRIYAAAIDAPDGAGFYAGVVVRRWRSGSLSRRGEVFRDERLDDGAVWRAPEHALAFALQVGGAAVRARGVFAACDLSLSTTVPSGADVAKAVH